MQLEKDLTQMVKDVAVLTEGSQGQVAEIMGISQSELSKIRRNGASPMSIKKMLGILERCGKKLVYSFDTCESVKPTEEVVVEGIDSWGSL